MFAAAHRFIKVTPFYLFHTKIPSKISLTYHQVASDVRIDVRTLYAHLMRPPEELI